MGPADEVRDVHDALIKARHGCERRRESEAAVSPVSTPCPVSRQCLVSAQCLEPPVRASEMVGWLERAASIAADAVSI